MTASPTGATRATGPTSPTAATNATRALLSSLALALVVLGVYAPVRDFGFLEYDDERYVSANVAVRSGLSPTLARYAMTSFEMGNWHPLTWFSHAGVVEAFGLDPAPHHIANVVLHAAVAAALLWTLFSATGSLSRSVLVAALFALHPLRVESVAWIAERKDVLVGLWFVLAIGAHVAWVRRPSALRYCAVLAASAAALMSKPMAVTLPAVLLLVDHWPLERREGFWKLALEKGPLIAGCAALSLVSIWAQDAGGAVATLEGYPWPLRVANAFVGYADYLRTSIWPVGLAVFYPVPADGYGALRVAGSASVVLALLAWAGFQLRSRPPIGVGLLWFFGMLVPVIGIVAVGEQARADRYTYLPSIGLAIAIVWAIPASWLRRPLAWGVVAVVIALCAGMTRNLVPHWRNDETLFARALAVTSDSRVAHLNYGNALDDSRSEEKRFHFQRAIELKPNDALAHYNLGRELVNSGEIELGVQHYRRSLALDPDPPRAWNNLGIALGRLGKPEMAERSYRRALESAPDHPSALFNLAMALLARGEVAEGAALGERYLGLRPADAASRGSLARALAQNGATERAIDLLRSAEQLDAPGLGLLSGIEWSRGEEQAAVASGERALALAPDLAVLRNDLAWMLATAASDAVRDPDRALMLARQAARDPALRDDPEVLDTLAAAEAASGDFAAALASVARAIDLAREAGRSDLAEDLAHREAAYRAGTPHRRPRNQ